MGKQDNGLSEHHKLPKKLGSAGKLVILLLLQFNEPRYGLRMGREIS